MADAWRDTLANALDWGQARLSLGDALADLPSELRGQRPASGGHSVWQLVEHLRIAQADLLADLQPGEPPALSWPHDYWPQQPAPASDGEWQDALAAIAHDSAALAAIARDPNRDLPAPMPGRDGRTALRGILLALDHASYHVGQVIEVRRALGAWPPTHRAP